MPASSADVIGAALASAYQQKPADTAPSQFTKKSVNNIEDQLIASSKQVLLNHVEFERVGTQQSQVLTNLKNKYVNLNSSDTPVTNSSSTGNMAHKAAATNNKEDQLDEPRVVLWPKERVMLGWRKTVPPGAGMVNLGNTCYMNSSLQALFHIPAMANWLMEDLSQHTQRCDANAENASYCSICAMMRTLRLTHDRSTNCIKPSLIHHKLKSIGKTLMYGRQEDAHEFLKLLLSHMEKCYLSFRKCNKLDHRSKETTPLNQIFGGYIRQQVICPLCRHVSTTFSHFQDLVLDIRSVNSVEEALSLYFKKETLDSYNAYKCEKCHKKVPATKRHLIEIAPYVLLIQLKRFTFSGAKIGKHINIQRTIDISKFVNGQKQYQAGSGSGPYQYRLASMVIHIGGSQHGGHYTAIAEASSGTMFEYDDSSVRSISVQSALMRNPYILFYELIRKPKDPLHIKQVVRQSSEKTLIRQNSDGVSRPIPTSHSASSVANGYGRASDAIGEAVSRNGISPVKPPLPSLKEREKITFGVKIGQNFKENKSNKIILNSGTVSLLSSKSSSNSSISSSGKNNSSNLKPGVSSLVPYHDDSEDSEVDDSKLNLVINGHKNGQVPNGSVNKFEEEIHKKNEKKINCDKGAKSVLSYKQDKLSNSDNKTNSNSENNKMGSSSSVKSLPFVPRSIQIVSSTNNANTNSSNSNNSCNSNSSGSKVKGDKGWVVTDNALHSPSESSCGSVGGTNTFTVVEQPTSSKEIKQPVGHEKLDNHGWTVTIRKQRPELEKSHSHDSVLPGHSHKKDEPDSASLRSKASVDSTRSDRSTKSVKKSIFSLFTCVSSSRSPDSPEDEQPEASHPQNNIQEDKSLKSRNSSPSAKTKKEILNPHRSKVLATCNSQCKSDSDSENEMSQVKRFRDNDDGSSSPSKKCRPEVEGKNIKKCENDSSKNGPTNVSKNGHSFNSKNANCSDNDKSKSRNNHEIGKSKNGLAEVEVKCKKKKKKHKHSLYSEEECPLNASKETLSTCLSQNGMLSNSENSESDNNDDNEEDGDDDDSQETDYWADKNRENLGKAKVNHNPDVIHWNYAINKKDLSYSVNGKGVKGFQEQSEFKRSHENWEGGNIVDELHRAGNFAFGTRVNSWGGGNSITDEEFHKSREEMRKRTADDLYNEEFDSGKIKKIKLNKMNDNINYSAGNVFQRVQDIRNSGGSWNNFRNNKSYGNNHYNNYNTKYQNRDGGGGYYKKHDWNNKKHERYHHKKSWNKFDKRDKFHKKHHKEKYRHWERRD